MFHDGTTIQFRNLTVRFLCLAFLLVADTARLHGGSQSLLTTAPPLDDVDAWTRACESAPRRLQLPTFRNGGHLARRNDPVQALIRESKLFQDSSLQIRRQMADQFKLKGASGTDFKMLAVDVDQQFDHATRCLWNSSSLACMEQLRNISDKTQQMSQLFYLTAARFDEFAYFINTIGHSAGQMLAKLERAKHAVVRRTASTIISKRKLKMAIRSLDKIKVDLIRQLEQERVQLETSWQLWQTTKNQMSFVEDEAWTHAKTNFQLAARSWTCTRRTLKKTQQKLGTWNRLDEELSLDVGQSSQDHLEIEGEILLLFNGTTNSIVRLERYRNLTAQFAAYYKEAGDFFLQISSRVSDIVAGVATIESGSLLAGLVDGFPATLSTDLNQIKCDLDRNGRFVILTIGESLRIDSQRKMIGFVLGGVEKDCDVGVNSRH